MPLLPFFFKSVKSGNILVVNQGGEFVFLSRDEFNALINANHENCSEKQVHLFKAKQLFFTDEELLFKKLLAAKLRTRKSFLRDFTSLHMMVLTCRCNCNCDYCHASANSTAYDMSWDVAKAAIDMAFRSPSPDIKIEFQGGEPILNWEVLTKSVIYIKNKNKHNNHKCSGIVICTNLLGLDSEKLQFCKEHHLEISSSLDGPQDLHDKHRKLLSGSSYLLFLERLSETRKVLGKNSVSSLLTITRDHLPRLREVIDTYISNGFTSIFLRALNPYGYAQKNSGSLGYTTEEFLAAYKDALNYIIELNLSGIHFTESYAAMLLQRILTPFPTGFVDLQSPSGEGISGVIYDFNGEVYPADEGRMLARTGDKHFLMGNVLDNTYDEIFNGPMIHELAYESCVETLPVCAHCAYQLYCGSEPIRYYVESGRITGRRPQSGFCQKNKGVIDYLFELIEQNDEQVMNIFWEWATSKSRG